MSCIGKDNLENMIVCVMVHLPVGLSPFRLTYLKLRSVVFSYIKNKKPVSGNGGSTNTAFAVVRRLYSCSGVMAVPCIAIDMSLNTLRHTETDMCHM